MSYVTLNGVVLPVAELAEQDDSVKSVGRSVNGTIFKDRRHPKRRWDFACAVKTREEAEALKRLVDGVGHHWSFDSTAYSDKGMTTSSGAFTLSSAGIGPKFSAQYGVLTLSADITFETDWSDAYTVSVWVISGGSWLHRVHVWDGSTTTKYEDGVAGAYGWSYAISSGVLTLASGGYDDLVVTPYAWPESWITSFDDTNPFTLPRLWMSGDAIGDAAVQVIGDDVELEHINTGSGQYVALAAQLREV